MILWCSSGEGLQCWELEAGNGDCGTTQVCIIASSYKYRLSKYTSICLNSLGSPLRSIKNCPDVSIFIISESATLILFQP